MSRLLAECTESHKKIAMGLLSYIPDYKDIDRLTQLWNSYQDKDNRKLFLWKDEETDNFVAIIGVELTEYTPVIRQLAVSPSFRSEGIAHLMLDEIQKKYHQDTLSATLELSQFLSHWEGKDSDD